MEGEGKRRHAMPGLDLDDFMGKSSSPPGPTATSTSCPDQQFANLYWFRKDWFERSQAARRSLQGQMYGYDLGVPVNWSAYEDIAEFFSKCTSRKSMACEIYGHMDYGKRAPDLGWRMTDAWLSMAGAGSKGEPNGIPDRRVGHPHGSEGTCNPVGASVSRGGAANGPAAVYAIRKWDEWLRNYAPPGAAILRLLPVAAGALDQGNVAQQIFWYTAFTADDGQAPKSGRQQHRGRRRQSAVAHGARHRTAPIGKMARRWATRMSGSWTHPQVDARSTAAKAAWLYAQFVVSKTVSIPKSRKSGLTLHPRQRRSTSRVLHRAGTEARRSGRVLPLARPGAPGAPTGINVPDYPKLAQIWWQQIGDVNSGAFTPQEAMDRLAEEMDVR